MLAQQLAPVETWICIDRRADRSVFCDGAVEQHRTDEIAALRGNKRTGVSVSLPSITADGAQLYTWQLDDGADITAKVCITKLLWHSERQR